MDFRNVWLHQRCSAQREVNEMWQRLLFQLGACSSSCNKGSAQPCQCTQLPSSWASRHWRICCRWAHCVAMQWECGHLFTTCIALQSHQTRVTSVCTAGRISIGGTLCCFYHRFRAKNCRIVILNNYCGALHKNNRYATAVLSFLKLYFLKRPEPVFVAW